LLEAGGSDEVPSVTEAARWVENLGTERDWKFVGQPNPHLKGRSMPLSMGKVLGGGSSINGWGWARGHKNDWDFFASESGDTAWNYESVLKIYRRIEDWQGVPNPTRRGTGGLVFVLSAPDPNPIAPAMVVMGLDQKLAALFSTTIDKIVINDMAVHQPTEQIFFSVERGHGTDAIPAIVMVNNGQLEVLELDSIPHSQVSIPMHGTGEMFGGLQFAFHERLVDDAFAVTSVSSLRCHASTWFRMGSKLRCIRSTSTAMQSIRENDFECLAKTGVNARDNVSSSGLS
jgi:hypothetical protein